MSAGVAVVEDGRHLRRAHNRTAVLDAMVALFSEGCYQPSTSDVARRAGISPRSLFRYFDDVDDLNRAAIDRHLAAARPLLEVGIGADAPTAAKIDRLVDARVRLYEAIAPAARAARRYALRHVEIARQLTTSRAFLRKQVRSLFAPELKGVHLSKLPVLDVLCSFETYELLRIENGLSRSKAAETLRVALATLLAAPEGCR